MAWHTTGWLVRHCRSPAFVASAATAAHACRPAQTESARPVHCAALVRQAIPISGGRQPQHGWLLTFQGCSNHSASQQRAALLLPPAPEPVLQHLGGTPSCQAAGPSEQLPGLNDTRQQVLHGQAHRGTRGPTAGHSSAAGSGPQLLEGINGDPHRCMELPPGQPAASIQCPTHGMSSTRQKCRRVQYTTA